MVEKIDDEWYLLNYTRLRYWKCDTLDGLLQELKRYID